MNEIHLKVVGFERICRLCLRENRILLDIFQAGEENSSIYQKIMACAMLSENDGLPTKICVPCLSSLNAAFDFRIQCENADKTLHSVCRLLVYDEAKNKKACKMDTEMEKPEVECKGIQPKQLDIMNLDHGMVIIRPEKDMVPEDVIYGGDDDDDDGVGGGGKSKNLSCMLDIVEKNQQTVENNFFKTVSMVNSDPKKEGNTNNTEEKIVQKGTGVAKKSACPHCHKMLTRVNEHIRLLHQNKVYICKKQNCGAEFLTLKNLQSHQLKCYDMEKPYKCLKCFKEFHRKCNYKAHVIRHSNKRDFQCQLCEKAFVDSTGLKRHFLKHHEPQQETFISICCEKKFKSKEGLKQHIQKGTCGLQICQVLESTSEIL